MSTFIFLSVLFAALLHAGWNAFIRLGKDKLTGMFVVSSAQGVMGLALAVMLPLPGVNMLPWLAGSAVLHSVYKIFLTLAYERGDLSRVYPIARGTAPMIVALAGVFVLDDVIHTREYGGIFLVGLGVILMARGVFTQGESRKLLPFAIGSAFATAGYSLVDGTGARLASDATVFVAWAFALDGVLFAFWAVAYRGRAVVISARQIWFMGSLAGAASFAAYWIVVQAMTKAPVALVAALRETSVLFAVLIGILLFREKADTGKLVAVVLIVAGVILTRI